MAYTEGVKTYTAYEDIPAHRVVVFKSASSTNPLEVQRAHNNSKHLVGVSVTSAKAGELISINPFSGSTTYEIESAGNFSAGDSLYIYTTNHGTVDNTVTETYIGTALEDGSAYQVCRVAIDPMLESINASEVYIEDSGDYYTSVTVEGALQEVGEALEGDKPASEISIVDAGGYYDETNVEGALQDIGGTSITPVAVEEFFTMDTTYYGHSGGHPADHDEERYIPNDGPFLRRKLNGSRYGASYIQIQAVDTTEVETYYMQSMLRLKHKPYGLTPGLDDITIELLHLGEYTADSITVTRRVTLIGMDDEGTETAYSTVVIPQAATKSYMTLAEWDLSTITQDISDIQVFVKFEIDSLYAPIDFYGYKVSYKTLPLFQLKDPA